MLLLKDNEYRYRPKADLPIWDQDGDGKVSVTEATQGYLQSFANVIFWGRKEGHNLPPAFQPKI